MMTTQSNINMNNDNADYTNNTNSSPQKDQIPTEYNEEQTQRILQKQHGIAGEARDKTIYDFPYAGAIARILKDLDFPTDKLRIIQYIELKASSFAESNKVLSVLQQIEEKQYNNVAEVTKAAHLVDG
jgi:hypothetical protein